MATPGNDYGKNYLQAEAIIANLMEHYYEERLQELLAAMANCPDYAKPLVNSRSGACRLAAPAPNR